MGAQEGEYAFKLKVCPYLSYSVCGIKFKRWEFMMNQNILVCFVSQEDNSRSLIERMGKIDKNENFR